VPDSFGQYRIYPSKPESIPDSSCELGDVSDIRLTHYPYNSAPPRSIPSIITPCPNISVFRLQYWHWNEGHKKSKGARESLVRDVICAPDFVPSDVRGLDWDQIDKSLATDCIDSSTGWMNDSVPIKLPPRTPAAAAASKLNPEKYTLLLPNFRHRLLTSTVIDAFSKNDPRFFHYMPYQAMCKDPLTSNTYRTYGEAYESQRMHNMHAEIQKIQLDQPCTLPRCAALIMAFSDATQLANFGHATAWPICVAFGNLSKYKWCKPNTSNHYEVGYMPSVSFYFLNCVPTNLHES
jgi:hypothetical protein